MPQCKEPHPNSPSPGIFLCIREKGHTEQHYTYDKNNNDYSWPITQTSEVDMSKYPDPITLSAKIRPCADGMWRFDISAGPSWTGDELWRAVNVDSYGWGRTEEKCREKAKKRMLKMAKRLDNLRRPSHTISFQTS